MEKLHIINNEASMRFEAPAGNQKAILEYKMLHGKIAFTHTEVPKEFEGKGIASQLATYAFDYARAHALKVLVYCPYITAFLKRYPAYNELVEKDLNV